MKKPSTRKSRSNLYWMKLDTQQWHMHFGHLHVAQQGILLQLCIWQAEHDAGKSPPIPNDQHRIALRMHCYSKTETAMLSHVLSEYCSKAPEKTLTVDYMTTVLADRRRISRIRTKNRLGKHAKPKPSNDHQMMANDNIRATSTSTSTSTEKRETQAPPGPESTLRVPLPDELTLTKHQTEELRIKNIDPQNCFARFKAHYAETTATASAWRQKLRTWVTREHARPTKLTLAASNGKTSEQLAQLEEQRQAGQASLDKAKQHSRKEGEQRLARLTQRAANELPPNPEA